MSLFNIKKDIKEYEWWNEFKFSIEYSKSGVARIYLGDRKTKYVANGYGYNKESAVIAQMINDLTIKDCKYNKKLYGNNGKNLSQGGVGFDAISQSFNAKQGCFLKKIYCGITYDVYHIKINKKLLWFNEKIIEQFMTKE